MKSISNFLNNALDKAQSQQQLQVVVKEFSKKPKTCQQEPEEVTKTFRNIKIDEVVTISHGLSSCSKAVLNRLLYLQARHNNNIEPFQEGLATMTGYTRQQVNRCLKILESKDLIKQFRRSYWKSTYLINPVYNKIVTRAHLGKILPSLRLMPAFLLLAVNLLASQVQTTNVTPNINNGSYKYNTRDSLSMSKVGTSTVDDNSSVVFLQKQREQVMRDKSREATLNLKSLQLTKVGQVFISCFPSQAISFADSSLFNTKKTVINPEGYLYSMLFAYCKANKTRPNWGDMFLLRSLYGENPFKLKRVRENKAFTKVDAQEILKAKVAVPAKPAPFVRPSQGPLAVYIPAAPQEIPNKGTELAKAVNNATTEQLRNISRWLPNALLAEEVKRDYDDNTRLPVVSYKDLGHEPDFIDIIADKEGF
jgi:predicted transcriptional regulator